MLIFLHRTMMLGALLALLAAGPVRSQEEPGALCRAAIRVAESAASIPAGLLQAIARVESGRRDPATGRIAPWPWTINAEGRGQFFQSREEAIAEVRQLQSRGVRIIDVGCMQINLHHHPNAFANLEEAFDPLANARYAARFLIDLQASRNDWARSAGNYHSNTPERAETYRAMVLAAWPEEQRRAADPTAQATDALALARLRGMMARASWSFSNGAERARIIPLANTGTPAAQAGPAGGEARGTGRGLDAYRAAPQIAGAARPALIMALSGIRSR